MASMTTPLPSPTYSTTCDYLTNSFCANDTGTGNSTAPSGGRNEALAQFEIFVSGLIFACAVIGNSVVLFVLGTRRKKLSRMNLMIAHLSIADLFVAFFNVLPQLIWDVTFRFAVPSDFLCRAVKYFQVVAMYASSYVLVSTAIDRYLAICHPLIAQTWTRNKTHSLVGTAWLLSLLFSVPQMHIFGYRELPSMPGFYDCWAVWDFQWSIPVYVTWFTVAIYIVPFVILAVAYGRICLIVWRSVMSKEPSMKEGKAAWKKQPINSENGSVRVSNNGTKSNSNGSHKAAQMHSRPRAHVGSMSKAKVKTVKLTMVVIACYLICWGPFFFVQMWAAWDMNAPFSGGAFTIILLLASLNSCTNPWIYLMFSDSLYRQLARCCRGTRLYDRSMTSESDSRWRSTRVSMLSSTEAPRTAHNKIPETKF